MSTSRYSLEPFFALTRWSMTDIQRIAACNGSEWQARKELGVTEPIADRIACAAGWHPHEIWPDMLDDAISDDKNHPDYKRCDECQAEFLPPAKARKDVRFCSRNCNKRFHYRRRYAAATGEKERQRARQFYAENADYVRRQKRRRYHESKAEDAA